MVLWKYKQNCQNFNYPTNDKLLWTIICLQTGKPWYGKSLRKMNCKTESGMENLNRPITNKEFELIIKNLPKKKNLRPDGFSHEFFQGFKEVCVQLLSRVQLFGNPWTVACQTSLSMKFSRQECWSGLPFPSPGDPPNPGIKPASPAFGRRILYHWATSCKQILNKFVGFSLVNLPFVTEAPAKNLKG